MRQITYKTSIDEETLQFLMSLNHIVNESDELEAAIDIEDYNTASITIKTKNQKQPAADPYVSDLLLEMKLHEMEELINE